MYYSGWEPKSVLGGVGDRRIHKLALSIGFINRLYQSAWLDKRIEVWYRARIMRLFNKGLK